MQSKKSEKLVIAVSVLAIAQSLVWMALCSLGVLIYFQVLIIFTRRTTHYERYTYWLYMAFATKDIKMIIILFLYFFLSAVWIVISIILIISTRNKLKNKTKNTSFLLWGGWTILICVFDLIVLGLLAYDYSKIIDIYNTSPSLRVMFSLAAFGTLFSLAARGYVLWVVNLTLAIIVIKRAISAKKKNTNINNPRNASEAGRNGNVVRGVQPSQVYSTAPPKSPSDYKYLAQPIPKIPRIGYFPRRNPVRSAMKIIQARNPFNFTRR